MTRAGRIVGALVAVVLGVAVMPSVASAHAYLIRTSPTASGVLNAAPRQVSLTYDEAVEPRFAIISVTNVDGHQETSGPVRRSAADPDTLVVPVRPGLPEGWYLIYWRAISVDGHPVQGAFTYAIGPDPGPGAEVRGSEHLRRGDRAQPADRPVGHVPVGDGGDRPVRLSLPRRPAAASARRRDAGCAPSRSRSWSASVIGVLAIPVYLDFAIASDSLRSVFDLGTLVPLFRVTAFGRGYVDMMLCFALFCVAAWIALIVDRPDRRSRSLAEILAQTGALLAAGATLVFPGPSATPARPRRAGCRSRSTGCT